MGVILFLSQLSKKQHEAQSCQLTCPVWMPAHKLWALHPFGEPYPHSPCHSTGCSRDHWTFAEMWGCGTVPRVQEIVAESCSLSTPCLSSGVPTMKPTVLGSRAARILRNVLTFPHLYPSWFKEGFSQLASVVMLEDDQEATSRSHLWARSEK